MPKYSKYLTPAAGIREDYFLAFNWSFSEFYMMNMYIYHKEEKKMFSSSSSPKKKLPIRKRDSIQ